MISNEITITAMPCGHGDCIILEWVNNSEKQVGIIDCNKGNDSPNKVVEYIKIKEYKKIKFLLISHTHDDHYSGVDKLIELCSQTGIEIEEFRYTHTKSLFTEAKILEHVKKTHPHNDYLKASLSSMLKRIMSESKQINKNFGVIKTINRISCSGTIDLNDDLEIKCLSPSDAEEDKYDDYDKIKPLKKNSPFSPKNNPATNFLSTFLILRIKGKSLAFFTSDIEPEALTRIFEDNKSNKAFNNVPKLIQIPHHGSEKNHVESVWGSYNLQNSHTFLSAGNRKDLPSQVVIDYFEEKSLQYSDTTTRCNSMVRKRTIQNTPVSKRNKKNSPPKKEGKKLIYKIDSKTYSCKLMP